MNLPPPNHQRLRLDLAYCGTPWRGWQSQSEGDTIQEQLQSAVMRLTKLPQILAGAASRTDAGVHALGQVVHVDFPAALSIPHASLRDGLNALLPETIRVLAICEAPAGFHASLNATGKIYRYRIWRPRDMDPFEADRAWHIHGPLDLDNLHRAIQLLHGSHNFVRLSANPGAVPEELRRTDVSGHTRTLRRVELCKTCQTLEIELEGDAFLYHMVRLIVGALLQLARGRTTLDWFTDLLASPFGLQNQAMAPAGGLYLVKVLY